MAAIDFLTGLKVEKKATPVWESLSELMAAATQFTRGNLNEVEFSEKAQRFIVDVANERDICPTCGGMGRLYPKAAFPWSCACEDCNGKGWMWKERPDNDAGK